MSQEIKKLSKYASLDNIIKNSFYEVNKDEIECQICNLLIIGPMQCPEWQNSLCSNCAISCKQCPICRKEVNFKKSIMINKLLSKLSFECEKCKKEVSYDNLISHHEESGNCKIPDLSGDDKYREKYFDALEKIKQLEIENSKLQNKVELMEYKLKYSEDKSNETIQSLKSMNDFLLKRENENKGILTKLSESFKRSNSAGITNSIGDTLGGQTNLESFKSKYHKHKLTYKKPNYEIAICDICRRYIFDIKNYHCDECKFDMCPTCKCMEEEKGSSPITTPLHKHPLIYHGNKMDSTCEFCKTKISPYNSFICRGCKVDICDTCLVKYKW